MPDSVVMWNQRLLREERITDMLYEWLRLVAILCQDLLDVPSGSARAAQDLASAEVRCHQARTRHFAASRFEPLVTGPPCPADAPAA